MATKKTVSFKKMIEKDAELYWLTFGEINAIIEAGIECCNESLMDKLYETKCVNCYRGILNASLLREMFEVIPIELPEDWTSEINSEKFVRSWILEKISDMAKWLGVSEQYLQVEDTTYRCSHNVTTDAIENEGRELIARKNINKNIFKGVLFPINRER